MGDIRSNEKRTIIRSDEIRTIVDAINESYFVPDIQRSYVWLNNPKWKKIEQLFDSLMRGFPIGLLLIWKLKFTDLDQGGYDSSEEKVNIQLYKLIEKYDIRNNHNVKLLPQEIKHKISDLNIVLDGQQRLTSLCIGLKGSRCIRRKYARTNDERAYVEQFLYLDLAYSPNEDIPDDSYKFCFLTHEDARAQNSQGHVWFLVSNIMRFDEEGEYAYKYKEDNNLTEKQYRILIKLYDVICKERNISYYEERTKKLDKVLKIFIRVNSAGVQLTYSDLLMSLLTANFEADIRDKMERQVDYLKERGFGCMGRDQILKTCLLLTGCNHVFKLENFKKSNINIIEKNWEAIIASINQAVEILRTLGYESVLSSGYIVTVVAYYLFCKRAAKDVDKKAIGEFVRVAQLKSFFSTRLDSKLSKIHEILPSCADFPSFLNHAYAIFEELTITERFLEDAIKTVRYGTPSALPLLQILYPDLDYENVRFHIDHIYPKSKFTKSNTSLPEKYRDRKEADYIYNLQLLAGALNEEKSNKDPESWLNQKYPHKEYRDRYLENNFIPADFVLTWENLPDFETKRKNLILNKLKNILCHVK